MAIVNCPKCTTEFDNIGKASIKKFCSRKCSNSRGPRTDEFKRNLSEKLKSRPRIVTDAMRESWLGASKKRSATMLRRLVTADFNTLSTDSKKNRVILEQQGRCLHCKISTWQGIKIKLQVDHIDGDSTNNARENLRGLCPNCHSQTETYCGRNKAYLKRGGNMITDERLLTALLSHTSISAALVSLGRNRNRNNYERCTALLNKHNATLMANSSVE